MSQICEEFHEWVEEQIEKPVEEWVEQKVQHCKQKKCKKWCLCCNKWFCWIEIAFVSVIKWVIITVGKWIVRVVCEVVNIVLDALAGIISLIFAIPIIGRLLRQIWDFLIEVIWRLAGLLGALLDWLGIDIEKKYRICIIILSTERGPLTDEATLTPTIQSAQAVWKAAANVRLIVEAVHTVISTDIRERNLDVECDFGAWTDDIFLTGSNFELYANIYCFDGAWRRLLGWASPVVVFVVRDVKDKAGCSLGPFSDYVTIEAANPVCLAHELGHSAYLWFPPHHDDPVNLMHPSCKGTELRGWQRGIMRNSRHITYL